MIRTLTGLAVLLVFIGSASASIFTNGGFETGLIADNAWNIAYGNGSYCPVSAGEGDANFITGWTGYTSTPDDGYNRVYLYNNNWGYGPAVPVAQGNQAVFFNCYRGPVWLSQTFDTDPGTTYTVGFKVKDDPADVPDQGAVTVSATGADPQLFSGLKYADGWVQKTYQFTATGASTTLTFMSGSDISQRVFLDDVTVTASPEPATMGLLAIGGLAAIARRRRA